MAGAGRKVFTAGDVLTAAQVQDYLQDQAVMNFATAAARTTAIASPTEGMVSYRADADAVEVYDGTNWAGLGSTLISTTSLSGASVVLSSIPQVYEKLFVVIRNFRPATDAAQCLMFFNGDTSGSNYTSLFSGSFGGFLSIVCSANDNATSNGLATSEITDYTNATTWKVARGFSVGNNSTTPTNISGSNNLGFIWNGTAAISSITLRPDSGNFTSGSVLLYGVN